MKAKKGLGQHFLMHAAIAQRIVAAAELAPDATVVEVGPGTGILTRALLARVRKVIAVETDAELLPLLRETFAEEIANGKLELVEGDIRAFDTARMRGGYAVVANIPYYITGEIVRLFLTAPHQPSSMTVLVQKEVAVRIARAKKESLLSLSVKAFGAPRYRFTVPRGAFKPAPNVDSAVLSVTNIGRDAFRTTEEEARFFEILHAGFAHKRKLLARNLESVASSASIAAAFTTAAIPLKARAEDVPLPAWLSLARSL